MIVTTPAEIAEATRRLNVGRRALGLEGSWDEDAIAGAIDAGNLLVMQGTRGVLWLHFESEDGRWWGTFMTRQSNIVELQLVKEMCLALRDRGAGDVPVMWQRSTAQLSAVIQSRIVGNYNELTPNEALLRLASVVVA